MEERILEVMGEKRKIPKGTIFADLAKDYADRFQGPILVAKQGNRLQELNYEVYFEEPITFLDVTDEEGMRVYQRGVSFLLVCAVRDVLGKDALTIIEHSLQKSFYCEIRRPVVEITEELLEKIAERMRQLAQADLPITKRTFRKSEAIGILQEQGMEDKSKLLRFRRASSLNLYEMDGFYDYFYGYMPQRSSFLWNFGLMPYKDGFLLRFPDQNQPTVLREFGNPEKVGEVFLEQMRWCALMGVSNVADLNETITTGGFGDLIRINEALHEKKIAEIADMIGKRLDHVKMVLIAGPSSSGKTSFANRLCVQLRVLGIHPHKISLDDYFLEREQTPVDENGKRNFESIQALDLQLLNEDLKKLVAGEEVELPRYNFVSGKREYKGNKIRLKPDEILVIEGIHGLNDELTSEIDSACKFRIFISAMTQLNMDDHNHISTADSRLIRRLVRDHQFRGRDATLTISTWSDVTDGEAENIFPFQENADVIFNSATIYELSVLKAYAEPLLFDVSHDSPAYVTAKRLLKFLDYFLAAPETDIPNNSLMKEFIGGSCFDV